jgi:hypothetical protein
MKTEVAILGAVAAATALYFWNSSSVTATYADTPTAQITGPPAVQRSVIQAIVEKIQAGSPWLQPINTVYINPVSSTKNGTDYKTRMMFLDTRGFYGQQYDVMATVAQDGSVNINNQTTASSPVPGTLLNSFLPDKYQAYSDIRDSLGGQLQQALQNAKTLPGTPWPMTPA